MRWRQSEMSHGLRVARMEFRRLYTSLVADFCMELESQADKSRSVSAQVTVSGIEISSWGCSKSVASDTVTNLFSYSSSQSGIS